MSEKSGTTRPSQVTMAGWVAVFGCGLLVLTLFDTVSRLRSVEFRDSIEEFLATPPGSGLGLEIPQVVEIMRVLMLISGAAAAAALVLAIYALRRHRGARIGYTVAAVTIMLTAPVSGSFAPVMIAFAAIMLWTKPARDWFAGVSPSESSRTHSADQRRHRVEGHLMSQQNQPPEPPDDQRPPSGGEQPSWPRMPEGDDRPVPPPTQGYGSPSVQGQGGPQSPAPGDQGGGQAGTGQGGPGQPGPPNGPQQGWGQHPGQGPYGQAPYGQRPPGQPQYGQQQYGQGQPPSGYPPYGPGAYGGYGAPQRPADPDQRPMTVTIAAWLTWVLSAIAILGFVVIAFVLVAARDEFLSQLQQDPNFQQLDIPTDQLVGALWVVGAIALFWGAAALVLAWFAYRRANWARIALVVSAGMTALFSLVAFPVGLLHSLGAIAVVVLLFVGGANEWYARRPAQQGFPGAFQPYGGGGPYGQQYGQQGQQYGQPGQYGGSPYGGPPPQQYGQPGQQYGQPGQQHGGGQPTPPYAGPPQRPDQPTQPYGERPSDQPGEPGRQGGPGEPGPQGGTDEPSSDQKNRRGKDEPPPNVW